jgi:Zn-dependent peptidase ImmA (M78 family)
MASEQIPITPALLTWARERAGFSVEEASATFKKIDAWERGEAFPTYPQLEQLADKFKLPIAVFFFPEPPELPPIRESFRTLPDVTFAQLPSRIQHLLRKAKALQLNLAELYNEQNPSTHRIIEDLAFATNVNVNAMADAVRAYLGLPLEEQFAFENTDEALKAWRRVLFNAGIFVFKDAFRVPDFSGFCLYDDLFPLIYINNTSAKTRQIFTLAHELAHLLFHTSGIDKPSNDYLPDLPPDTRQFEILCNRFAAALLVPDQALTEVLGAQEPSEATATTIAERFSVSREVIFRKFLDRNLIDEATYRAAAARWAEQGGERESGGNPYWTKIAYLGREYISRALSEYQRNRITEQQLANYLDWKPRYLATLQDYFYRGVE